MEKKKKSQTLLITGKTVTGHGKQCFVDQCKIKEDCWLCKKTECIPEEQRLYGASQK